MANGSTPSIPFIFTDTEVQTQGRVASISERFAFKIAKNGTDREDCTREGQLHLLPGCRPLPCFFYRENSGAGIVAPSPISF